MASLDPWRITSEDRARYDAQFTQLSPSGSLIGGDIAKGFFLQSGLPPVVLGQIWALADINADGRMDRHEFSIAMFLIKKRLEGFSLPTTLPAGLRMEATPLPGAFSLASGFPVASGGFTSVPMAGSGLSGLTNNNFTPVSAAFPLSNQGFAPVGSFGGVGPSPANNAPPSASMPQDDWAVPATSRSASRNQFQRLDRTGRGFLTGPEARGVLLTSGLPQHVLAQVWTLADVDRNGKLSLDEFQLAMYLVDAALAGQQLPAVLPLGLIPPPFRTAGISTPIGSDVVSRRASLSSTGSSADDKSASEQSNISIEDRRRENFLRGQAELERRQAALREQMRQEEEARLAKDRAEREKAERLRQEKERQRQAAIEQQRELARQAEEQREAARKQAAEERERQRVELHRQRLLEAERRRMETAGQERQREIASLEGLKARASNLTEEANNLGLKVTDTQRRLEETRAQVTSQKHAIEAMRQRRDSSLADIEERQLGLEAARAELASAQREREELQLRVKSDLNNPMAEQNKALLASHASKKESNRALQRKLQDLNAEMTKTGSSLAETRNGAAEMAARISQCQVELEKLRQLVMRRQQEWQQQQTTTQPPNNEPISNGLSSNQEFGAGAVDDFWANAWSSSTALASATTGDWAAFDSNFSGAATAANSATITATGDAICYYTLLYDFTGRHVDELSCQAGDRVWVDPEEQVGRDADWLFAHLCDSNAKGLLPESYVTLCPPSEDIKISSAAAATAFAAFNDVQDIFASDSANANTEVHGSAFVTPQQPKPAAPVTLISKAAASVAAVAKPASSIYVEALYEFEAKQGNHLSFVKGEVIRVLEMQSEWWSGELNGRVGWFPKTFVGALDFGSGLVQQQQQFSVVATATPSNEANLCVTLYAYNSGVEGDLAFQTGETLILESADGPWWEGYVLNEPSRKGAFPSNYVRRKAGNSPQPSSKVEHSVLPSVEQVVIATTQQPPTNVEKNTALGSLPGSVETATVIAPYSSTGAEQLELVVGQTIILKKKKASGWWEGETILADGKRRIGWFPANYVRLDSSQITTAATTATASKQQLRSTSSLSQSSVNSSAVTNSPTPSASSAAASAASEAPKLDQFITLYPYTAAKPDELTFAKGVVITVLSYDEPDWWMGEVNGQRGLFPNNYVKRLNANGGVMVGSGGLPGGCASPSFAVLPSSNNMENQRQFKIVEFVNTEKAYYESLREVQEIFIKPFSQSGFLSAQEMESIFLNWSELLNHAYIFYIALKLRCEQSGPVVSNFSSVLLENLDNLDGYVRFCACQNNAVNLLSARLDEIPAFAELHRQCMSRAETKAMPLHTYFVKPVQRITRYPLLIEEILKFTSSEQADEREDLKEAMSKATKLVTHVNEAVRERENSGALEWLQQHVQCEGMVERLIFNGSTNCMGQRKLLHYGTLFKTKNGKELVGFLFNDFFMLTSLSYNTNGLAFVLPTELSKPTKNRLKLYRHPFLLINMMVVPNEKVGNPEETMSSSEAAALSANGVFTIRVSENKTSMLTIQLRAQSEQDRKKWVERLENSIRHYQSNSAKADATRDQLGSMRQSARVGRLMVIVDQGISLKPGNSGGDGKSDPFCELTLGSQRHSTKVVKSSLNPKWNASMTFYLRNPDEDVLCLTVYDKDDFSPNDFLGRTELRIKEILHEKNTKKGKIEKRLKLQEVPTGEVQLTLDVQLFDEEM